MTTTDQSLSDRPTRVRIHSHVTQSRFLHVEDALHIGKLRLFAGTYRRGEGMQQHLAHYLDLADARVIFAALAAGEAGFAYREYKGSPTATGKPAESRILSVTVKGTDVYVELKAGPGKLTPTGAVTPDGPATTAVNVGCKLHEARRLGAAVLAYVQAWDVYRLLVHQEQVRRPEPFQLVSAERLPPVPTDDPPAAPATPANGAAPRQSPPDRPVTSRAPTLRYGDGTPLAAGNAAERDTVERYRQAVGRVPPSRAALQAFYAAGQTAAAVAVAG